MRAKSTGNSSDHDKRPEFRPIDDDTTDGVEAQMLREKWQHQGMPQEIGDCGAALAYDDLGSGIDGRRCQLISPSS